MVELIRQHYSHVPDFRWSEEAAQRAYRGSAIFGSREDIRSAYTPVEPGLRNRRTVDVEGALADLKRALCGDIPVDVGTVGGLLTRSATVRARVFHVIDVDPHAAYTTFSEVARRSRGPARIHALTAAGIAALRAGEIEFARAATEVGRTETEASLKRVSDGTSLRVLATLIELGIVPDSVGEYWSLANYRSKAARAIEMSGT